RLENPIAVYCNEAAPLRTVRDALLAADRDYQNINPYQLAAWHFEDEQLDLAFEQQSYSTPRNGDIKQQEPVIAGPAPFFIQPKTPTASAFY
ncbi:MAG: alpha/beta fold hydrolase, partial [Gammaproteobacteria bacterium]